MSEMLKFIHSKDQSTLSKRYSPAQLQAAYKAMGGAAGGGAGAAGNASLTGIGQEATNRAMTNLEGTELGGAFNPTLTDRASSGDMLKDRARVEEALFGSLTRNFDRDRNQEFEAKKQELANLGIPYDPNPQSRYQREMQSINERFDTQRENAHQNATILGGQEWERGVGINETIRGNELREQGGIRNQQLTELGGLAGLEQLAKELQMKRQLTQAQVRKLNQPSGGAPAEEASPFYNSTPPGL